MGDKTIILVPVDGSKFAETAVPYALSLAQDLKADVQFVSAYDSEPVVAGWAVSAEDVKDWFEQYLNGLKDRVTRTTGVPTHSTVVGNHSAPKSLERFVKQFAPELIVMSTHGRGPISRAWLGSVADRLARHVSSPLLLVRPTEDGEPEFAEAPKFKNILLALDGSERAECTLTWGKTFAAVGDTTLFAVRVVLPPPPLGSPYLPHAVQDAKRITEERTTEATEYLQQVKKRMHDEGIDLSTDVISAHSAASGILHYVVENDIDLVVIASHGRGGVPRLLLGSVADKVIRAASTPILLIRPSN